MSESDTTLHCMIDWSNGVQQFQTIVLIRKFGCFGVQSYAKCVCLCLFHCVCLCVCLCHCHWVLGDGCFGRRKAAIKKMWRREKVASKGEKKLLDTRPNQNLIWTKISRKYNFRPKSENGKGSVTGKTVRARPPCGFLESTLTWPIRQSPFYRAHMRRPGCEEEEA